MFNNTVANGSNNSSTTAHSTSPIKADLRNNIILKIQDAIISKDYKLAIALGREFYNANKNNKAAFNLLSNAYILKTDIEADRELITEQLAMDPNDVELKARLIQDLVALCQFDEAFEVLDSIKDTQHPTYLKSAYKLYKETGDLVSGKELLKKFLITQPYNWEAHNQLGTILHSLGQRDESIAAFKKAYDIHPDKGIIYWGLANIKSYSLTKEEKRYAKYISKTPSKEKDDIINACYALGKIYEDEKDYENSYKHYRKANDLQRSIDPHDARPYSDLADSIKTNINEDFFAQRKEWGADKNVPVFVVGMPRSGSTLTEQILVSHSEVDGTGELPNIIAYSKRVALHDNINLESQLEKHVEHLLAFNTDEARYWGDLYLKDTQIRRGNAKYFVDKMPSNYWYLPFIYTIFKQAKVIDIRRHPMSVGLAVQKQSFNTGHNYSNGQKSTAERYKSYMDIMDHYEKVAPGNILTVYYENLVQDTENQIRRMLDYISLPFEKRCLDFYKTKRPIKTPSAEQVRQPIYKDGLEHWKNYEEFLQPLKQELGEHLFVYEERQQQALVQSRGY